MGCTGPESVIEFQSGLTFLDLSVIQIETEIILGKTDKFDELMATAEEEVTNDPCVIGTCIEKFSGLNYPDKNSVLKRMKTVDKCFSHDTVEEIIDALENEAVKTLDPWCYSILKKLKDASPLSLKIREGRFQSFDQCLIREYWLTSRVVSCQISSDFYEGVRARLVDGQGSIWWDSFNSNTLNYSRPHIVEFINSKDIVISNITFLNPPAWTIHPAYCSCKLYCRYGVVDLICIDSVSALTPRAEIEDNKLLFRIGFKTRKNNQ